MKIFFILLSAFFVHGSFAEWTAESTQKATVVSFDKNCVQLKTEDGKVINIKKTSLKHLNLEPGTTKIEFQLESLSKVACEK